MKQPSGLKVTLRIGPSCRIGVVNERPVIELQIRIAPSSQPVINRCPSGLNATHRIGASCRRTKGDGSPERASQTRTSAPAASASRRLLGLNARAPIGPVAREIV